MEATEFNHLLLKTAFACTACDGDIDPREVESVRELHEKQQLFGNLDLQAELDKHVAQINANGLAYLQSLFHDISEIELNEEEELALIRTAIITIRADDRVDYSELKFFKILRSRLHVSNDRILEAMPDVDEFLEQDIFTRKSIERLTSSYFDNAELPQFGKVKVK